MSTSLSPPTDFSQVLYPTWFKDKEQDYIVNIVSQAYSLDSNPESQKSREFLLKHLHERFGGQWQVKINHSEILNVGDKSKAAVENGEPFWVTVHLNKKTIYSMWKKKKH